MSRSEVRAVLSDRQREVLAALERLSRQRGIAPSLRELADEVGLASPSTVLAHVRVLEQHQLVERWAGRPRTLRRVGESVVGEG